MTVKVNLQTTCMDQGTQGSDEGSKVLDIELSLSKDCAPPSHLDEFPEGGLVAWSTAFGS